MRSRLLFVVAVLGIAAFAFGAIGCSSSNNNSNKTPQSTAQPTSIASETPGTTPSTSVTPGGSTTPNGTPQASAFTTVVASANPGLGSILTTYDGLTVYTFDNDTNGTSSCTGACASTWPPLPTAGQPTAGAGVSGTLSTIQRDDGSSQVTYNGKPLYLYSGDSSAGQTNGDGLLGLWHVVKLS